MKLPNICPSCDTALSVTKMKCTACETEINGLFELPEMLRLTREEQKFVMEFFVNRGSIKEMAKREQMSYPTMRNRMDDLIEKVKKVSV